MENGLDAAGEGQSTANWETSIDIYTSMGKINNSKKLLYNTRSPAWGSVKT